VTSRHAAALVLLGWYVMIPPKGPSGEPEANAPLTQWFDFRAFDSARECREFLEGMLHPKAGATKTEDQRAVQQGLARGRCISSDDPRLAK